VSDAEGLQEVHTLTAHITSFCCCASLRSFSTAQGQVDGSKVAAIAAIAAKFPSEAVLGWFVHLTKPVQNPSTVEENITRHLAEVLQESGQAQPDVPLLFGLFSSSRDHDNATLTFQHRLLQQNGVGNRDALSSVKLQIANLGHCMSHDTQEPASTYPEVRAAPILSTAPVPLTEAQRNKALAAMVSQQGNLLGSIEEHGDASWPATKAPAVLKATSKASQKALDCSLQQTRAVEGLYQQLLADMDKAARQTNSVCLALKAEQDKLRVQQVARG
jgi:hypothetical protein